MTSNGSDYGDIKLEIVDKDKIFSSSFSSLLSGTLNDVKLVFDDGVLHLDKLTTGVLFPFLSDDLEKMIGVEITLLLPQFSTKTFRTIIESEKIGNDFDNHDSMMLEYKKDLDKDDNCQFELAVNDDSDFNEDLTNAGLKKIKLTETSPVDIEDRKVDPPDDEFEDDELLKKIKFTEAQSHPLEHEEREVEPPNEWTTFKNEKSMIEYLYFYCKSTNTPAVKAFSRFFGEFSENKVVSFQCTHGFKGNIRPSRIRNKKKAFRKNRTEFVGCPWFINFKVMVTGEVSFEKAHLQHEKHELTVNSFEKQKKMFFKWLENVGKDSTPKKKDRNYCSICDKVFRTKGSLYTHNLMEHSEDKEILCDQCSYSTKCKSLLQRHIEAQHEGVTFQCEFCDYRSNKNALYQHIRRCHGKELYLCDQCDYSNKVKTNLIQHKKSNHGVGKTFECDQCDYKALTKYGLQMHQNALHKKSRIYQCPYCDHKTHWRHCIHKHIRKVHKDKVEMFGDKLSFHLEHDGKKYNSYESINE